MQTVVEQYVRFLRLEVEKPSLNYLQRLIQNHLSLVPYETFSKFHYYMNGPAPIPSLALFVDHLFQKGWGGTCFTLNINFARLLTQLGFECSFVRVNPSHLAIMVQLNGKRLYVDVGYGSPITKPVELEAKNRHVLHGFGEEIIFTRKEETLFEIDRRSNGKSFVKKEVDWRPLQEEDIQDDIAASYEDEDQNKTMRRISAVRFNGHQCFFLRNETMKVMTFRHISEVKMTGPDKWKKTVQQVFQIDEESLDESLTFLKHRGITIFKD